MISLSDITTQLSICRTLGIAFQRFYNRTKVSAHFSFTYDIEMNGLTIDLGFNLNEEPTKELYSILFEEILDAEQYLLNEYIVNNTLHHDNIKQFHAKHKEDLNQIIEKHKRLQF